MINLEFDGIVFQEGNTYVAYSPKLDVSSCGGTVNDARNNLKTRLPILLLLSVLIFILCAGELFAANTKPVDCISITNFYPRAPDNVTYYTFGNPIDLFYGYMPYFRGFIPPGAVVLDLLIIESGKQMAVARHKIPPTGLPQFPPTGYTPDNMYTLSELEVNDQWTTETEQGYLYIAYSSFYPLDVSRAGWLYVKVDGGSSSSSYSTQFSVKVDTKKYNEWWDKYIKNAAGWKTLVESVETYVDPESTHVLSVAPLTHIQTVSKDAGTTTFDVSNTGTNARSEPGTEGKMPWAATVTSGGTWLSIKSGSGGSNSGTITCAFTANTGTAPRTGTIQVKADEATTNSPVSLTVTQTANATALNVTPSSQSVSKDAGTTTFSVSNAGTGTMPWTAAVTSDSSWLKIISGASGSNSGTITCSFTASTSERTGTIRVMALSATGSSPKDVTVTQATTPSPSPSPSPSPTPATPAKPTVDPPGGTEFSISPAQVKVTSTSATQIYYTLTSSTDGSQPDEPSIPIPSFPVQFKGEPINGSGSSGTLDLPYIVGGQKTYTIYKVKFQGENASGSGEVSDVLHYTVNQQAVNQPIKQADAKNNPGVDYTYLIKKQDGSIDPSKKFLIPALPELPETLSEYSVEDLVLEYLRTALPKISIEPRPCKSGTVLIVKDASWGETIYPLIVEKISGNADADNIKVAPSGNIEIIYRNILIVLNMAGAYEDQLTQMMVNDGLNLEYGSDHVVVISSDSNQVFKLVYRYQFGAVEPTPLLSGDNCTVVVNTDGTYKITYGNGTTQNLIPGVIDAAILINLMKDKDGTNTKIDPTTGYVTADNNGKIWTGLPDYHFWLYKNSEERYTFTDDQIVFYSKTGTQSIFKKK